jgi:hypothetical protein
MALFVVGMQKLRRLEGLKAEKAFVLNTHSG